MFRWMIVIGLYFVMASAALAQEAVPQNTGQWQLTFDVIRSKVSALLQHNDQLKAEYRSLQERQQKLWHVINEQSTKNDATRQFLKERSGKTDQQLRIEELENQLKMQKAQLIARQREANDLKTRSASLQHAVDLKKLKISDWELHQNMSKSPAPTQPTGSLSGDPELDSLRKDLETQKTEEARLEDQLALLTKTGVSTEIKLLQQKLELLRKQKEDLLHKTAAPNSDGASRLRHDMMVQQKAELESRIRQFEATVNAFKDTQALGSWASQKKKMIHDIVQVDTRNGQLRERINNLREDIALLKNHIAGLEKRAAFRRSR